MCVYELTNYPHTAVSLRGHLCHISRHEAERMEQEAKGRLERQKITDEAEAEKARRQLLELQAKRYPTKLTTV